MSIDTETPTTDTDADRLARELGDAITSLPEYQAYLDAKSEVESDREAQERIEEFEQVREEYLVARQTNQAEDSDKQALTDAKRRLHALPVMKTYLRKQAALENRLQELDDLISQPLAVDFGEQAGSCCQD
ncbi:YlbF family regulator [Halapricum desulfuricans]|uniref:Cell fate regulator YlbF, YheA/YmcA/DUF963 family (Controls sporulation, competence, biofilm development) n=1 Tax=Halapricum desulfuricans TaxID=2841257 RepID=A0A897NPX7_9EURY|nr:YlbF family regulator [Halapricum desulfuricans]QSG14291.1 Cell fate regulator YlbF, YheA/YmcA/DUF963 family (controls sporulation, competence, biofilm development) [Halapricum desulfuricans]